MKKMKKTLCTTHQKDFVWNVTFGRNFGTKAQRREKFVAKQMQTI